MSTLIKKYLTNSELMKKLIKIAYGFVIVAAENLQVIRE